MWVIRDRNQYISTGATDLATAEAALRTYIRDCYDPAPAPVTARLSRARHMGVIYFISTTDVADFPIKIGYASSSVKFRLATLQTSMPFQLKVLATTRGSLGTEAAYHRRFSHLQMRGEWFQRSVDLMEEILRLRNSGSVSAQYQSNEADQEAAE